MNFSLEEIERNLTDARIMVKVWTERQKVHPDYVKPGGFNPARLGPRTVPAWDRMFVLLGDGRWHSYADLVEEMMWVSDLTRKSVQNRIADAVRAGLVVKDDRHLLYGVAVRLA